MTHPSCDLQCAKYVDYVLNTPYTGADDVGVLFIEAQQGEGGYLQPPPGYLEIVKKACDKHGSLFVSDEVQAGAGRTGKMWSIEHANVQPDMITWGKGMGGDVPMAGVTLRKDLAEQIEDHSQPNTWAGNAVASAACLANIDILTENGQELIERAAVLGQEIKEMIQEGARETRVIGDVRGRGLMIGIEMVEDKESREPLNKQVVGNIIINMLNKGMLMVPCGRYGNVFRFMPPLVLTRQYAHKAVDILLDATKAI
jgi:4-aminobutyrate aminotransferase